MAMGQNLVPPMTPKSLLKLGNLPKRYPLGFDPTKFLSDFASFASFDLRSRLCSDALATTGDDAAAMARDDEREEREGRERERKEKKAGDRGTAGEGKIWADEKSFYFC